MRIYIALAAGMIVARSAGPILELQRNRPALPGAQIEFRAGRNVKQSAVGFDPIVTGRQIERRPPFQEEEMRLIIACDFQGIGIVRSQPQALAVEKVHA